MGNSTMFVFIFSIALVWGAMGYRGVMLERVIGLGSIKSNRTVNSTGAKFAQVLGTYSDARYK